MMLHIVESVLCFHKKDGINSIFFVAQIARENNSG